MFAQDGVALPYGIGGGESSEGCNPRSVLAGRGQKLGRRSEQYADNAAELLAGAMQIYLEVSMKVLVAVVVAAMCAIAGAATANAEHKRYHKRWVGYDAPLRYHKQSYPNEFGW